MPFAFDFDIVAALALGLALVVLLGPSPSTRRRTMDTVVPVVPGTPPVSSPGERADTSEAAHEHEPSIADVLVVKAMLTRALALPIEIADAIADLAEYWPHSTVRTAFHQIVVSHHSENIFLVSPTLAQSIPRLCGVLHAC